MAGEGGGFCILRFLPGSVNERLGRPVPITALALGGWEKKGVGWEVFSLKIISFLSRGEIKRDAGKQS